MLKWLLKRRMDYGILVLKWKDIRDVLMLSTKHDGALVETDKYSIKQEPVVRTAGCQLWCVIN